MKESFTPYNKVELVACLHEIDRWLPITVKPAAAKVLGPWKLSRVGDVLELKEVWPYGRLRILVKREQPSIEVIIESAEKRTMESG
jgi:hypothetical protein